MIQQLQHQFKIQAAVWTAAFLLAGHGAVAGAGMVEAGDGRQTPEDETVLQQSNVAVKWGVDNGLSEGPAVWVAYEPDFGERHVVDFEKGIAQVEILLNLYEDAHSEQVVAHLQQGVGNLALSETLTDEPAEEMPSPQNRREVRIYVVRPGDTLWGISKKFQMAASALADLNNIKPEETLHIGRPIKVRMLVPHDLSLEDKLPEAPIDPVILDQLRMVDGSPVDPWMVKRFAGQVVGNSPLETRVIKGNDGIERRVVSVSFKLVDNHIEIRARKFYPLVSDYAEKHDLVPALIMAIIHTESMFNPRARSSTPAYGLMQLVPHSGAREAYRQVYGKPVKPSARFLLDPKNNVELGTAYFNIIRNRYMRNVRNHLSREYCAVAAYNAGAANVGRAFTPVKSMNQATPVINRMAPEEVYDRLVEKLPYQESRNYVRKVLSRVSLYEAWGH